MLDPLTSPLNTNNHNQKNNMKINKFTTALVAMGVISLAGAAQAANPVVYLTGSTAARAIIYGACTTSGQVFDAGSTVVSANNSSGASQIVYEGKINTFTVDIDCSFTGSEAGIAAVAGQPLTQNVNSGTFSLPGVPPSFLTQASTWATAATLPSGTFPDLTMADTSQAVSLTSKSLFPLNDYGIVGIVPFTLMKGYEATPDSGWNGVVDITTGELNQNLAGPINANFYTGNAVDATNSVIIIGRNKGSGTRVNALLNFQYPVTQPVDQWAYDAIYPSSAPGVLTFGGSYAAGQGIVEVGNDGYDSGGSVATGLNVDGTHSGNVLVGYLGISDAASAHAPTASGAGPATYLPYNGVYESDSAVENGSYSYWGQEHLIGQATQTAEGSTVGAKLKAGINSQLISAGDGTKTGAVGPTYSAQSILIPIGDMQASRTSDSGFPVAAPF